MKKIFALVLALAMCLPLCACGTSKYVGEYVGTGYIEQKYTSLTIKDDGTFYCEQHGEGTWEEVDGDLLLIWEGGSTERLRLLENLEGEYELVQDSMTSDDAYVARFTRVS